MKGCERVQSSASEAGPSTKKRKKDRGDEDEVSCCACLLMSKLDFLRMLMSQQAYLSTPFALESHLTFAEFSAATYH